MNPLRKGLLAVLAAASLAAGAAAGAGAGPGKRGAAVVGFTVHSRLVGGDRRELAVVPAGVKPGERRPLLVFLHGRGGRPGDIFWDGLYAELARLGGRAPVVVEVDGGDHSYYHDRRSGRWGSYVIREAIPAAVRGLPADPKRVAIGGISMGGFAALDLARLNPGRFCAAGGHSPAIWLRAGDTAPGAFDDAADFARHDVYAYASHSARPYGSLPVWIDRGGSDPFTPGDAALVAALKRRGANVVSRIWPGGHNGAYWRAHVGRYVRWYAAALARCRGS